MIDGETRGWGAMMHFRTLALAGLLALIVAGRPAAALPDGAQLCSGQNPAEGLLHDLLEPESRLDQPGFVFVLTCRDGSQLILASGAADIEQARPNGPHTLFHVASLSKQITAAAVAVAINDGLISLDDPLSAHVEEASRFGSDLTLAHLLYMTSGLPEYTSLPRTNGEPWATFHYFDVEEAIQVVLNEGELQFEPGTQWAYSNINYMLLAEVIEHAYEQPFSDIVEKRIFAPLGMDASLVNDDVTGIIPSRATGYTARTEDIAAILTEQAGVHVAPGEGWVRLQRNAPHYGGSGVFSSARDWGLWQIDMMKREGLGDAFWSLMLTTRAFEHSKTNDAFGLVLDTWDARPVLWYSGGDIDTSTYSAVFPEDGFGVACFANDPFGDCESKAREAITALTAMGLP